MLEKLLIMNIWSSIVLDITLKLLHAHIINVIKSDRRNTKGNNINIQTNSADIYTETFEYLIISYFRSVQYYIIYISICREVIYQKIEHLW